MKNLNQKQRRKWIKARAQTIMDEDKRISEERAITEATMQLVKIEKEQNRLSAR